MNLFIANPLPVLKDAEELEVFTQHIPKQTDIKKILPNLQSQSNQII